MISIRTIQGREKIPYVLGAHQMQMPAFRKGESDLCLVNGKFYLNVACERRDEERQEPQDLIGVNLGIKRLATTSEGVYYTGGEAFRSWGPSLPKGGCRAAGIFFC